MSFKLKTFRTFSYVFEDNRRWGWQLIVVDRILRMGSFVDLEVVVGIGS